MISASQVGSGGVSDADYNNIAGLSSGVQSQLNARGAVWHGHITAGGTVDAITATVSPARVLAAGDRISFLGAGSNTGAVTLALTGATPATAIAVQKGVNTALAAGDIILGRMITAIFNGSDKWIIPNYGVA